MLEPDRDRLPRGQCHRGQPNGRGHQGLADVRALAHGQRLVEDHGLVREQQEPADAGDAELVGAGLGGPDHAADLQPVDLLGGADRGEPVHPPEHRAVALLRADELAGRREEPHVRAGARAVWAQQPGRAGRRGTQVAERSRRERHVEAGGAEAVERGHRVGRVDGGAPAAERPGDLGVRADEGDPAEPGTVQREQRALVAGQYEAGRCGRAQLAGNVDGRRGGRSSASSGGDDPPEPPRRRADIVEATDPVSQPQDADHLVVDEGLVDPPGLDRLEQGVAPRAEPLGGTRHG